MASPFLCHWGGGLNSREELLFKQLVLKFAQEGDREGISPGGVSPQAVIEAGRCPVKRGSDWMKQDDRERWQGWSRARVLGEAVL